MSPFKELNPLRRKKARTLWWTL